MTGFTIWGFWQSAHWKPAPAMLRPDFSEKPNAKVWREWVRGKWLTHATGTTDADGRLTVRGHLGDYDIAVKSGEKPHAGPSGRIFYDPVAMNVFFPSEPAS